jgi:hypothetical protein
MRETPMTNDAGAKARATAHGLIQSYIGTDHKVLDMKAFYSALVETLRDAEDSSDPAPLYQADKDAT